MSELFIFIFGVSCGIALGSWWTWHLWLKSEKPVLHITVDKEVAAQLAQEHVCVWLDMHGLTWQPKGAVFELGKGAAPTGRAPE